MVAELLVTCSQTVTDIVNHFPQCIVENITFRINYDNILTAVSMLQYNECTVLISAVFIIHL